MSLFNSVIFVVNWYFHITQHISLKFSYDSLLYFSPVHLLAKYISCVKKSSHSEIPTMHILTPLLLISWVSDRINIFPFLDIAIFCISSIISTPICLRISKSIDLTEESYGHCTVKNGITLEYGCCISIICELIICFIATLIAVLLPIPESPKIVKLSAPPITPFCKLQYLCFCAAIVHFLFKDLINDKYNWT